MEMTLFDMPKAVTPITQTVDAKLVAKLRSQAEALQAKIDHAGRPMTQNPTPKRNREYQSRMHDCRNFERTQRALRALADAHEHGTVPEILAELKTRDEIAGLVRKSTTGGGGYYSVIECDDFSNTTPAGRALQAMIDGPSAERAERERLRKIEALEAEIKLSDIPGYFPTQPAVISLMLDWAKFEDRPMLVCEPSAGNGNIADAIRNRYPAAQIEVIELNYRLREILKLKGYTLMGEDFTQVSCCELGFYDRIVMNPPFEKQQDIDHVRRAYSLLGPDGIMVSIMSPSFEFRTDRKSVEFRAWLESVGAEWESLPEGSFKASGTGVSTRMVRIHR